MRETPESLPYGNYLPDVYRFAFLMTGRADTAADVLRHTVGRAARDGLNDIRNPLQAKRWLFAEARTLCAEPPPAAPRSDVPPGLVPAGVSPGGRDADPTLRPMPDSSMPPAAALPGMDVPAIPDDPPQQLAMLFADLPEAERTALILFYLFLFDPAELAELLGIKATALGPLLLRGRTLLQRRGGLYESLFATVAPPAASVPTGPSDAPAHATDAPPAEVAPDAA